MGPDPTSWSPIGTHQSRTESTAPAVDRCTRRLAHRGTQRRPRSARPLHPAPGSPDRRTRTFPETALAMKKVLEVALGVLTAIGGFVDIGELVTAPAVGARFGMTLAWATVLSLFGIMIFAEMSGRVAAMSGRPVFDLVRERLGAGLPFANLAGSFVITFATVAAEL